MNPECLNACLTSDEREFFNSQGYLVVPGALDAAALAGLLPVVDKIDAKARTTENQGKMISVTDVIQEDPLLVDLIDLPAVFPKIWGILGWNIYLYHSHVDVTPPADDAALTWRVAWHQDSMRVNDEIETHPRPRLSLKVGYYLTDVSTPDRGNTLIVPGSQLWDTVDCPADGVSNPEGSEPLCLKPGDAVIIDRRIWHSRSPNLCDETRKVIWYGYSYRWLKPKDAMTVSHIYPQLDPIRRQILGAGQSANGVYDPIDGDVPLKLWLQQHAPAEAERSHHGRSQSRPPAMVRGKNSGRQ
jgi:ectoine hydroxylase